MASDRATIPSPRARIRGFPGDPMEALPALMERHGSRIHAMALRICGNRADADDAVQESFLDAFRGWRSFQGRSDPGTWLTAIALRRCRRKLRSRRRRDRSTVPFTDLMPWNERVVTSIGASHDEPSLQAQRREALSRVQSEIARLPDHLRVPVVLKEVIGLDIRDVATILALAENTVKTRVHRGRLALRKAMMAAVPTRPAPPPIYEKQVCVDLLKAKMDALDRGAVLASRRLPSAELCARCRAVFRELDLVNTACAELARDSMPASLRASIMAAIRRHEHSRRAADAVAQGPSGRRPGRPPVSRTSGARR